MQALGEAERAERIEAFVRGASGEAAARVRGLRRLAGGSSRQVWSLDLELGEGAAARTLALALRFDPTAGAKPSLAGAGLSGEFRVLAAAHAAGVPVPRVHWSCADTAVLGGAFYLMDRIDGETIATRILREPALAGAREKLPGQLGRALARIHAVDVARAKLDFLAAPPPGTSSPEAQLQQLRATFDAAPSPNPTAELVFRWLARNLPPERGRTLVHGDFRMGNVIVGPDGLRAVIDWELPHVGDPHEDLAWMCTKTWRFGRPDLPVGGVGEREPFYRAYEAESGRKLDRDALRYWEVLGSAKVLGVWIHQVNSYLSGILPSVEQATIGRRMPETELDLLQLLDPEGGAR
jgi:aminoglycoside phosphotransferase (APT) family kinase protein